MENDYCNKCGECCRKIAVDFKHNIIYRDGIQTLSADFASMLKTVETKDNVTICECKYLKDNLCTNQNKPEECKNYPSSPFAFLQEDCGYYGAIFSIKESFMQKLRKMEEEIIHYEALINCSSKDEANQYRKIIEKHKAYINKYKMYF